MLENMAWTAIGWLVGYLMPGSFRDARWYKERAMRQQQRRIVARLRDTGGHLQLGRLQIANLAAVQVFEPPVKRTEITCDFHDEARALPPDLEQLERSFLPGRIAELQAAGRTVDLNDRYALRRLRVERPQVDGVRRNRPVLTFEPSNFKYYLMLNDALDRPLLRDGARACTIRERYLEQRGPFEWRHLEELPVHPQFGAVTAVTTNDGQLVIAIRSGMQAITASVSTSSGQWQCAMSCAEGMLRPVDSLVPPPREEPNPFTTARRSLEDELGLRQGTHFAEDDLKMLGVGFDLERFQPVGVFHVHLDGHGFMDVYSAWQTAKDRQENAELIPVAVTSRNVATLLRGGTGWRGRPARLFSNHQQLGVLLAGLHLLGAKAMIDALD